MIQPTPYPGVNAVLNALFSSALDVLGNQLVGMYLYGSLAGGDFNPQTSDIDFVVVTAGELPGETIRALEAMHERIAGMGLKWAARLEGAYVAQHALRRHDPTLGAYPTLNEGRFYLDRLGSDWVIQRHILREHGALVMGPAPHTFIDPVSPGDIRRAVLEVLHGWWASMLETPARLNHSGYQPFAVISMCRVLHALDHGTVVSKPVAARWAQRALDERWTALIERALAWRPDTPPEALDETLDFIRYTLEISRPFESPAEAGDA